MSVLSRIKRPKVWKLEESAQRKTVQAGCCILLVINENIRNGHKTKHNYSKVKFLRGIASQNLWHRNIFLCSFRRLWSPVSLLSKYVFITGSIFLQNRRFIIQERFNKLIYGIDTIIKCGT